MTLPCSTPKDAFAAQIGDVNARMHRTPRPQWRAEVEVGGVKSTQTARGENEAQ